MSDIPQEVIDKAGEMLDAALDRCIQERIDGVPVSKDAIAEVAEYVWNEAYLAGQHDCGCSYCSY